MSFGEHSKTHILSKVLKIGLGGQVSTSWCLFARMNDRCPSNLQRFRWPKIGD